MGTLHSQVYLVTSDWTVSSLWKWKIYTIIKVLQRGKERVPESD